MNEVLHFNNKNNNRRKIISELSDLSHLLDITQYCRYHHKELVEHLN